jgi:hypothetical protein
LRQAQSGLVFLLQRIQNHAAFNDPQALWDVAFTEAVSTSALLYDWLYEGLSLSDRDALRAVLVKAMRVLDNPTQSNGRAYYPLEGQTGLYRLASYDHWGAWLLWATASVGYALLGDHVDAPHWIEAARRLFGRWGLTTLNDMRGGAWTEGAQFGGPATWALLQTATLLWTAEGENSFAGLTWWEDRARYLIFASTPSTPPAWASEPLFGLSARQHPAELTLRAQALLLRRLLGGASVVEELTWFLDQTPPLAGAWGVEEFLWTTERPPNINPPPFRSWVATGTGHVFWRSNWAAEPLSLIFNAGDHFSAGQFYDQGNLLLWRGDDPLLVRGGALSSDGQADSDANFFGRTASANTLFICDLAESFDNIRPNPTRGVWLNDCGQRGPMPFPLSAINPFYRAENPAPYETGTLLRFADLGEAAYARAELSAAYNSPRYVTPNNSPKVQELQRELVYLRPDVVLVHDRARLPNANTVFFSRYQANAPFEFVGAGYHASQNGDSRLVILELSPQAQATPEAGYEVAGEDFTGASVNPYEPNTPSGLYRLRISPPPSPSPFLLTLLYASEQALPLPQATFIQGAGVYGVVLGRWQVLFDMDAENLNQARFEVSPQVDRLLLTGLSPLAAYRLVLPNGRARDFSATDAGLALLTVDFPSGAVRLIKR